MHTKIDYHCDATMTEKRAIVRNDRASTLQQHAIASTAEVGGRFAA
jgi:hypothetical protein